MVWDRTCVPTCGLLAFAFSSPLCAAERALIVLGS